MTTNSYDLGDKPRLLNTFAVDGTNTDPTAVVLVVKLPDGTYESYLSDTGFTSQGNWNANTNSPALANGTGTVGHYYTVTTTGAINFGYGLVSFVVGDFVAYDGESWVKIPSPQAATLTKSATGIYVYFLPLHQTGRHFYRFEGFGTVHAADEGSFRVKTSSIR